MFSKANKPSNASAQSSEARPDVAVKAVPSIISADLSIKGDLDSNGEIQVDGVVNGDIRCKALIVGVKGSVVGEVVAQTVRMHGAVKGMIRAKSVFLASTARMSGDVEHESLAIEPGAYMEGHCKRITETAAVTSVVEAPRPVERPMIGSSRVGGMPKPAIAAT
jgi:cytoskeletal protein CcmA (bactofilin family)